jgi:hypothetical protein
MVGWSRGSPKGELSLALVAAQWGTHDYLAVLWEWGRSPLWEPVRVLGVTQGEVQYKPETDYQRSEAWEKPYPINLHSINRE